MVIIKFEPKRAEKMLKQLTPISERAGVIGYLTGLVQDLRRCITVNMTNDAENDLGDTNAIKEIEREISEVETLISGSLSTAIIKSEDKD